MVFFITFLRTLAACLITNAHYTGIYPTDLIANGGLIGDVIFFAVSGYCLYNVKDGFIKWYGKRLYRIYPAVFFITAIYAALGFYKITSVNFVRWFVFPTHYHFVASIIILYIIFYFIMKNKVLKENLTLVMLLIAVIWLFVYAFFYDKSYYHIDNVYEPMIRFLFLESMLLGAYFKKNDRFFRNDFKWINFLGAVISFIVYFASKLVFVKIDVLARYQFLNQIIIFVLLYYIFRLFAGVDSKLEQMPEGSKKVISMISSMTFEIYLVQYVIIDALRSFAFFPINWIVLTGVIFITAGALHKICNIFYYMINSVIKKKDKNRREA